MTLLEAANQSLEQAWEAEKCLTVGNIAERWQISKDKVRRIFDAEPGVLRFGEPSRRIGRRLKRRYFSLRVPLSVFRRVEMRLQQRKTRT
jgi:hypothetical protein